MTNSRCATQVLLVALLVASVYKSFCPAFAASPVARKGTRAETLPLKRVLASVRKDDTYYWLPGNRVLLLRHIPNTSEHRAFVLVGNWLTSVAVRKFNRRYGLSLHSNVYDPIVAMGDPEKTEYRPPYCSVSADGKWLLWICMPGPHTNAEGMIPQDETWVAARLDGSHRVDWKPVRLSNLAEEYTYGWKEFFWFPDSRRWLSLWSSDSENGLLIRSVKDAKYRRIARFPYPFQKASASLLGITDTNFALLVGYDRQPLPWGLTEKAEMCSYPLSARSPVPYRYTIHLPERAQISEMALSPQGDRLIWFLQNDSKTKEKGRIGIWVSDKLGRKFYSLTRLPAAMTKAGLRDVHWTPDGKSVGFLAKNALWVLPVIRK